jgi:hypothetical protein
MPEQVTRPSRCRMIHILLNKARARWFRPICWPEGSSRISVHGLALHCRPRPARRTSAPHDVKAWVPPQEGPGSPAPGPSRPSEAPRRDIGLPPGTGRLACRCGVVGHLVYRGTTRRALRDAAPSGPFPSCPRRAADCPAQEVSPGWKRRRDYKRAAGALPVRAPRENCLRSTPEAIRAKSSRTGRKVRARSGRSKASAKRERAAQTPAGWALEPGPDIDERTKSDVWRSARAGTGASLNQKHPAERLMNWSTAFFSATRKPRTCAACAVGYFSRAVTLRSCIAFRHEPPRVMRWLQSPLLSSLLGRCHGWHASGPPPIHRRCRARRSPHRFG